MLSQCKINFRIFNYLKAIYGQLHPHTVRALKFYGYGLVTGPIRKIPGWLGMTYHVRLLLPLLERTVSPNTRRLGYYMRLRIPMLVCSRSQILKVLRHSCTLEVGQVCNFFVTRKQRFRHPPRIWNTFDMKKIWLTSRCDSHTNHTASESECCQWFPTYPTYTIDDCRNLSLITYY